jgi:hypothetical protein
MIFNKYRGNLCGLNQTVIKSESNRRAAITE